MDALRFVKQLYEEAMFPGVFAWTARIQQRRISRAAVFPWRPTRFHLPYRARPGAASTGPGRRSPHVADGPVCGQHRNYPAGPRRPGGRPGPRTRHGHLLHLEHGQHPVIDAAQQFLFDLVQSFDPDVARSGRVGAGQVRRQPRRTTTPLSTTRFRKAKRLAFLRNDPVYAPIAEATGDRPNKLERVESAIDWALQVGLARTGQRGHRRGVQYVHDPRHVRPGRPRHRHARAGVDQTAREIRRIFHEVAGGKGSWADRSKQDKPPIGSAQHRAAVAVSGDRGQRSPPACYSRAKRRSIRFTKESRRIAEHEKREGPRG